MANKSKRTSTRPAIKQEEIVARLREKIVLGKFLPGARLPTRTQLEASFDVSSVTVQRALDALTEDGFVNARGSLGTFVAEYPPHLSRYGLVFSAYPTESNWTRFWTALSNEAVAIGNTQSRRAAVYYHVQCHPDEEAYVQLLQDVAACRLAGLILPFDPAALTGLMQSAVFGPGSPPKVAIVAGKAKPDVPTVRLNVKSFIDRGLDWLQSRGRQKVAVLSTPAMPLEFRDYFVQAVAQRNMRSEPAWMQAVSLEGLGWAHNVMQLLMAATHPPDSLIITDDNLVEAATAGLVAAGIRVPEQLDVVAHCNFPWPTPSVLPAQRLGFDARVVMQTCLECIDAQRRGETVPAVQYITALFEHETHETLEQQS